MKKTLIVNARRRQTIKCQRKKNLIKKCYELAKLCNLKINLVIYNQEANCLQQYSSHEDFKIKDIQKFVEKNKHLKVKDGKGGKNTLKKNFIENMLLDKIFLKSVYEIITSYFIVSDGIVYPQNCKFVAAITGQISVVNSFIVI